MAAVVLLLGTSTALAKEKEVTVKGEAKCAACMLKQGDKCQTVIQSTQKGKTVNYYVVQNDVSKGFTSDVCHKAQKVTATGTVKKEGDKRELTLTKIELAK